jgi:putative salt-induced outer membrane protein YdiY
MMPQLKKFNRHAIPAGWLAALLIFTLCRVVSAQPVILHLKSGDQISGLIISENTNQVVISNAWVKALSVPLAEISKREAQTNAPALSPAPAIAKSPKAAPAAPTKIAAAAKPAIKLPAKPKGTLKGEVQLGLDAVVNTTDQQDYSSHLKLTYERPYDSYPKEFFRNTANFDGDYQRTDGKESANHGYGNNKSDFDLGKKCYGYTLFGAGFDEVQKIDFQYQAGPGLGMHVIQATNFVLDVESGLNYQVQYRQDTTNLKTLSLRLAHDFTWNIYKNLKLVENWAFYPDTAHNGQFQNNFETTLSYGFWKNLSLNLTALDNYNTEPAPDVANNRFEIRSSLGVLF